MPSSAGEINTSCGPSSFSERCTFCSVRISSIWRATPTPLASSDSSARGVPTFTAITTSAQRRDALLGGVPIANAMKT